MKCLLAAVNAKYIHSNPAIYSLKRYAEAKAPELKGTIELAEYTINQEQGSILANIYSRRPDVLGFSCYIWNWKIIQSLVREIHKLLPNTAIWLGGPEVSYDAKGTLETLPELTGVMVGEGEESFLELMQSYRNHEALSKIQGLFFHEPDTVRDYVDTGMRKLTELSEVPFLYDDLAPFENRIIYYESARGCPFRCSYCLSSIDKTVRLRDIDIVRKELQFFLDHRVAQVKFVDRTFNCNHAHAMAIWKYIKENDNGVTNFHFEIEGDLISEEELELLSTLRPGLAQMEIGVQSTNPKTLEEIRRYAKIDRIRETVMRIRSMKNIHVHLDLIAGLPFEDYASFRNSFNEVYAMEPEQLQLGFLKVLKGSYMQEKASDYGLGYLSEPPYEVLFSKWLSFEEVVCLKRIEEMVELYYNSNQYTHILPVLLEEFTDPFSMYEALADYYEEKGYFVKTPSRAYRYEVLLNFAISINPGCEELYKELMTYDMYLRENLKSRAGFMRDLKEWYHLIKEKSEVRGLARKDVSNHVEVFFYPVWEKNPKERLEEPALLLFDYTKRDPLTQNAEGGLL